MNQKKIAVLFGGASTEYEVSLQSAHAVITHIDSQKYETILIGITKKGNWYLYSGKTANILNDTWFHEDNCTPVVISPDKALHGLVILKNPVEYLSLDAILPVLHGKNGEDGTVQGLIELAGIPLIGCGTLCSALCMDKHMAHSVVGSTGIHVPKSVLITQPFFKVEVLQAAESLSYPLFVKPVRAGSSFGITKVSSAEHLLSAIYLAFEHDSQVVMEQNIQGFEVGCAIMGQTDLVIGEVDEIQLSDGFFDFTEKYTLQTSSIHVPARISLEKATEIKETALNIYRTLGCEYFARVDMFLTPEGDIYFNEVNTIPGFTSHSRYPNMLKSIGISFAELIDALIEMVV